MSLFTSNLSWNKIEFHIRLVSSVLAGILSLLIAQVIFQDTYVTADEGSYVFQANCFRDGVIGRPLPPIYPVFKHVMIILQEGIGWMSRYSPGHSLWLLPGVCLNAPRLMSAIAAGLSVWLLTGCARLLSVRPVIVLVLIFCSPYFLLMHGTLLSHTSAQMCFLIVLWAYLAWVTKREWRYAAICGLAWGFMFLIRNYTAVLMGAPFAVHALVDGIKHRNRTVWIGLMTAGLSALLGVALLMFYNYLAVGDAFKSTYLAYDPSEGLGFGMRHNYYFAGGIHTWQQGVQMMLDRLTLLDRWVFGFQGSLALVAVLWLAGWTFPWSLLLAASAASVWIGYIFFFSQTVDNIGPYYYFETLSCLLLAAALGIQRMGAWLPSALPIRRGIISSAVLILAVLALRFFWHEGSVLKSSLAYEARVQQLIRRAPPDSLIILSGLKPDYGELVDNPRGLRSRPLVVRHMSDAVDLAVARCFPDRTPYIMRKGLEEYLIPLDRSRRLEFSLDASQMRGYTGGMETMAGAAVRATQEGRDESHWMVCSDHVWIGPGRFKVYYEIACSNVVFDKPVTLDVDEVSTDLVLAKKQIFGSQPFSIHVIEFVSKSGTRVEPRIHYGGSGQVFARSVRLREEP